MGKQMNCLKCRTKITYLGTNYGFISCKTCKEEYLVIEKIPIMVNEQTDFYRYNRKFKRLVDLKNEKNEN